MGFMHSCQTSQYTDATIVAEIEKIEKERAS